ncbi:hypothetical protein [Mycobacterium sp. 852002-51057_SCH5723018]|nr:hypothetical protein [Mycobacterium sp. 852002-51057_SCH5723018]
MDVSVEDISIAGDDAEIMKAKGHVIQGSTAVVVSRHRETIRKGGQQR